MLESFDTKIVFALFAAVISVGAFIPYLIDIWKRRTTPHAYTWFIWCLTQGTAAAALLYGNGGWGALALALGTFFVFIIFLVSLKYGTRNITKSDTVILVLALLAIFIWWQLDSPLTAVFMVSAIDVFGYIPSWRKSIVEPWSETVRSWFAFSVGNIFALLALGDYNFLTATYLVSITFANLILVAICLWFRRSIPKPVVS